MHKNNLRKDFQGKIQPTKPRSPLKTFAKWTAIAVVTPPALFIILGIAGVWDGTPEDQARWAAERQARQAAQVQKQDHPQKTYDPAQPSETPALEVKQASTVVTKQRSEDATFNVQPSPICSSLNALDSYLALYTSGRWEDALKINGCITLPEQTEVVVVRRVNDYVRAIWTLKDGSMIEGWVSGLFFATQSIHDLDACRTDECTKALLGRDG